MEQTLRRFPAMRAWLLLLPATFFLAIFFVAPLLIVLVYSFLERDTYGGVIWLFTLENFQRVFDSLYLNTFLRSIYIAFLTTLACLLLGQFLLVTPEPGWFGFDRDAFEHVRAVMLLAALWFAVFAVPLFLLVPDKPSTGRPLAVAARGRALLAGRPNASFEDVRAVALPVLQHRILLDYRARLFGLPRRDRRTPREVEPGAEGRRRPVAEARATAGTARTLPVPS